MYDKNCLLKSCRNLYDIAQQLLRNREYVSTIHINHVLFPTFKADKGSSPAQRNFLVEESLYAISSLQNRNWKKDRVA